jgi:ABC-type sugar transport system substrate-binding protein
MAWPSRSETSVRFTLATSLASGLLLPAILNPFHATGYERAALTLAGLTLAGLAAFSPTPVWKLLRARKRSRRAFFMTSAFRSKYYVAEFVQHLHSTLDSEGVDLVLKVPDQDYDASAQCHHLRRILERRTDYLGGIIFASEVHRIRDDLIMFCRNSRLPIVFTDIEPFDIESDYPENSAFIGYDTGQLGELAGKWLVTRLRGQDRPRVLIIASSEHNARQKRCEQALRSGLHDVEIETNDKCEFIRSRAYDAVRDHVRQLGERRLDAIFCTNDEMALGAVDALAAPSPATRTTVVVGVDGVHEARALIDTGCSQLQATVIQDTQRLAVNVVDLLAKMHGGRGVPKRTFLRADVYERPH